MFVKNEHASSIVGEVSAFDSWVELWVHDDADYERACSILDGSISDIDDLPWNCSKCCEENDASFELCWNCGAENS